MARAASPKTGIPYGTFGAGEPPVLARSSLVKSMDTNTGRPPKPLAERLWSRVDRRTDDECWPWLGAPDKNGYGRIKDEHKRSKRAHRVAYELEFGSVPSRSMVCHSCDNPPCCNPAHLFLGSATDNNRDRASKGRSCNGERHHRAKLNASQVREIRNSFSREHISLSQLGRDYGVSAANIQAIVRGDTWRHLLGGDANASKYV